MSIKLENFLVLLITCAICAGVIAWSFFLNFGKISIQANVPFEIHNISKQTIVCQNKQCFQKVPIGTFEATFTSAGYHDITQQIVIKRFQTTNFSLNFILKPVLISHGFYKPLPYSDYLPVEIKSSTVFQWDKQQKNVAYIKTQDSNFELFIWNKKEQKSKKITNLFRLQKPIIYWGNTGKFLLLQNEINYYLIDLEQKMKTKIKIEGINLFPQFSPSDQSLLYYQDNQFCIYSFEQNSIINFELEVLPKNVIWTYKNSIIYFKNENKQTTFYAYAIESNKEEKILSTELMTPESMQISSDQKSIFFNSENNRYELKIME